MSEPTPIGAELGDPQQLVARLRQAAARAPRRPAPPPPTEAVPTLGAPPRVPPRYHARLDDLEQTGAVKTARVWLDRVREQPDHDSGLLILGLPGRGKSLIAGALAVEMGAPQFAQFWPTPDLIRAMQGDIGQRDRIPVGERILRRRLLVLDDIGAEQATDWRVGELNGLLEAVYSRRMLLVATSNLTLDQFGEHLGERAVSRLHEMTDLVVVDGPDRRKA
ncbi:MULTISPECIES: ATP-binding protein [unclassified Egicoccus]|uniref:ATP-binding protein n=1 Tax=unclassified Egicoccus TaxID=2635606 RepID=UPI00359D142A